jgi:Sulfotransferase domain
VTDVPCAIFWKELVEAYPTAKVVLTVRDSTDAWYKSYSDTINYLTQTAYLKPSLALRFFSLFLPSHGFDRLMRYQILYTPRGRFEAEGRDWYEQHNAAVIAGVPKENLLVFNVKQGWEPLCKFLGKEVPQKPFPRVFETEQYLETLQKIGKIRGRRAARRASVFAAVVVAVVGVSWGLRLKLSRF